MCLIKAFSHFLEYQWNCTGVEIFASDLLVLRLSSFNTIDRLCTLTLTEDPATVSVMCLGLYFSRLNLFAVNTKSNLDAKSRIAFIWASLLWTTSIRGISVITKRNYACACIPLVFIAMGSDVCNLRHVTSEPSEHMFGMRRYEKRELTVSEMCKLVGKLTRKLNAIYDGNLKHSRDPKKGYQSTMNDFIEATKNLSTNEARGPFEVTDAALEESLAVAMWEDATLPKLLQKINEKMKSMPMMLGVDDQDMSPFFIGPYYHNITEDLKDPFIDYMPSKTTDASVQEDEKEEEDKQAGFVDNGTIVNNEMLHKRLIDEFLATLSENTNDKDKEDEEDAGSKEGFEDTANTGGGNGVEEGSSLIDKDDDLPYAVVADTNANAAMAAFQRILDVAKNADWSNTMPEKVRDAMATMDLKKRDKGSTSIAQKSKSLIGRWFTKIDVKELLREQSGVSDDMALSALLGPAEPKIQRNVIVRVQHKGTNQASELYVVLAYFTKHYNKWLMTNEVVQWTKTGTQKRPLSKPSAEMGANPSEAMGGTTATSQKRKRCQRNNIAYLLVFFFMMKTSTDCSNMARLTGIMNMMMCSI